MPSLAKSKIQPKKGLQVKRKLNKKYIILITVVIAAIGAYLLFFASAATNNCQAENNVQICDVDQAAGGADTVLSTGGEAESLGAQGWGVYYGAAFRAPTSAYNGAVPIHRVFNTGASYHDFVTDAQKGQKEAKYGANNYEGIAFFAWTTQQPNTVPVYRVTRGGSATQAMFSTDRSWVDNMLAQGANNPDGWKVNQYGDEIAFYAYPPNYKVADTVNPYDCSILENFVSSRCDAARTNLVTKINNGAPVGSTCPESLDLYLKAPFVSQFDAACQKKWNDYMQRCDVPENFNTDRCKGPREALAAAQKAQIEARKKAEAEAAAAAAKANPTKYPPQQDPKTDPVAKGPAPNGIPAGCPGTNVQGPKSPKTKCPGTPPNGIPAGCPGSNVQGPKSPNVVCPTPPNGIPAGCPGSNVAGPKAPNVVCPGTTTTPSPGPNGIPAGCPGSNVQGPKSPNVVCPGTKTVFECNINWEQERTWPFSNDKKSNNSKRSFGADDYASAKTWCKNTTASFLATRTMNYMGNVVDPNPNSNCNGGISKDPCRMYGIEAGLLRYGDKTKGFSFYYQSVYEKKHYVY